MIENTNPEYFLTIVAEKSISKAAEKLFVSQSYLSQYVTKLEKKFGIKLLDRTKTPLKVTAAGKLYCEYLETNRSLTQQLSADFDYLNRERSTVLNLGLGPWRGSIFLPEVLPKFMHTNPNVQIIMHEVSLEVMYEMLEQDKVDLAIMNTNPVVPDSITTEIIRYETAFLLANRKNPLTEKVAAAIAKGQPDALKIIENEPFFLVNRSQPIGNLVQNYLAKGNIHPRRTIITTNTTTITNLIAANLGFGFLIDTGITRASKDENLVFINLKTPDLYAPLSVAYKKGVTLSIVARDFINTAKEYYASVKLPLGLAEKK